MIDDCEGKLTYNTYRQAHRAAIGIKRRHGKWKKPYLCRDCNKFHLTSRKRDTTPYKRKER